MGRRSSVVAATALLALGAGWFTANASQDRGLPGGDRDGTLLRALRVEASALAAASSYSSIVTRPAALDSCDGRKGTQGWTDTAAVLDVAEGSQQMIEDSARARGWVESVRNASPYESRWKKQLDGRTATLWLLPSPQDASQVRVAVVAQPPGPKPTC